MVFYVIAIRLEGGSSHEHIAKFHWHNRPTGETGITSRADMVRFIRDEGGDVRVAGHQGDARIIVVDADPPHLRTSRDGRLTNNLLSLPRV